MARAAERKDTLVCIVFSLVGCAMDMPDGRPAGTIRSLGEAVSAGEGGGGARVPFVGIGWLGDAGLIAAEPDSQIFSAEQ